MTDRALRGIAGAVFATSICLAVAGFLLKQSVTSEDAYGIPFLAFTVVGLVVVLRRPRNSVGWVFLVAGSAPTIGSFFMSTYAVRGSQIGLPGARIAEWMSTWAWFPGIAAFMTFGLLLFPSGTLPSTRWKPVAYLSSLLIVIVTASFAIQPGRMHAFDLSAPGHENPFGWEAGAAVVDAVLGVAPPLLPLLGFVSLLSLIFRYRHSGIEERQQIKWFAYSAFVLVVIVGLEKVFERVLGEAATSVLFVFGMVLPSVGAGVGILKYRLFDIDVVINRTLVYGVLTAILVGVYVGVVFVLQQVMTGITQDSDVAVAASTLAVAALFRPLRAKLQAFIDQRFYRRKYDAAATLARFSSRLRDQVDLESVNAQVLGVVRETIQPSHASLWLRPRSGS